MPVSLELLRQLGLDAAGSLPNGWQVGALAGLRGLMPGTLPVGQSPQYAGPQGDPMSPWDSVGGPDFLAKSMADRQAFYDRNSLSRQAPALMGKETAGIGDIPVGNQMTPARRWSGMDGQPGGGLEADPLGATRMSQPIIGGFGPDADAISRQARAAKYQQDLDAIQALDKGARPIIEGTMTPGTGLADGSTVPNRSRQILDQLEAMPNVPESTRQQMAFAGLNTGTYDRMMDGPKPLYSGQKRADLATQQKVAQGNRAADLATRRNAVADRARRKGEAREMRMQGAGPLVNDKQMQMFQMLAGGGMDGPASMSPGNANPALLTAIYGPQVGAQIAEQYRLTAKDQADNARGNRALDNQDRQLALSEGEAARAARDQALASVPMEYRTKPGLVEQITTGTTADNSIAQAFTLRKNAGQSRDQIVQGLIQDGYPSDQVQRIIDQLSPVATQPSFWDIFSQIGGEPMASVPQPMSKRGVAPISMGQ